MVQWNEEVPTVENVLVWLPELMEPMSPPAGALLSKTTLWVTPELFVKVTVVPFATVRLAGLNDPCPEPPYDPTKFMQIVLVPQVDGGGEPPPGATGDPPP